MITVRDMGVRIQLRNDLAINWSTKNPILAQGEIGIESDSRKLKIGDGINTWNHLIYYQFGDALGYLQRGGYIGTAQDLKDEIDVINGGTVVQLQIHLDDFNNPHQVTATQVGLGNVDNTSDINKPVSIAQQTALDLKVDKVLGKGLSTNDLTDTLLMNINKAITNSSYIIYSGDGKKFLANNGTYIDLTTLDGGNASTTY